VDDESYETGYREGESSRTADVFLLFTEAETMDELLDGFRAIMGRPDLEWPEPPGPQVLACAVCLYVSEGVASPADTVIGGLAVCEDHASRAPGSGDLSRIIAEIRKERPA